MKVSKLKNILKDWEFKLVEGEVKVKHPTIEKFYTLKELLALIKKVKKPEDLPPALAKIITGKTFEDLKKEIEKQEKMEKLKQNLMLIGGGIVVLLMIYFGVKTLKK